MQRQKLGGKYSIGGSGWRVEGQIKLKGVEQ